MLRAIKKEKMDLIEIGSETKYPLEKGNVQLCICGVFVFIFLSSGL